LYFSAGDSNTYLTGLSTHAVAIGTQFAPVQLQVSDTSINMPTAVYMNQANTSTLNVSSIVTQTSTIQFFGPTGVAGGDIVMSYTNSNSAALGIVAANNTDGVGIVADNGSCQVAFGGANGFITGVSSINGSAPALTSGGVSDVAALFSTLFAANPSLSTITL
jgi:hypothetical protein